MFLKCDKCGHLNELKSPYLVFCSHCNRKIENNFTSWQSRHPERTYDEFLKLVCMTDANIQTAEKKSRKKNKGLKYWIGFTIALVLFSVIGRWGGNEIVRFLSSSKSPDDLMQREWVFKTYGKYGLTVETPVVLTKTSLEFPDEAMQYIESAEVFGNESEKGLKVMVTNVKYVDKIGQASLEGAALGSVNEMKKQKGVTDFRYEQFNVEVGKIPARIQSGSFKENGVLVGFMNLIMVKNTNLWQVATLWELDDYIGAQAGKRVIDSVKINESVTN